MFQHNIIRIKYCVQQLLWNDVLGFDWVKRYINIYLCIYLYGYIIYPEVMYLFLCVSTILYKRIFKWQYINVTNTIFISFGHFKNYTFLCINSMETFFAGETKKNTCILYVKNKNKFYFDPKVSFTPAWSYIIKIYIFSFYIIHWNIYI